MTRTQCNLELHEKGQRREHQWVRNRKMTKTFTIWFF